MATAVYPGSFDPVTLGHCDIIERISKMMDYVIIGVLINSSKTPLFSVEERVEMLKPLVAHLPNVEVKSFDGLLVDFVKQNNAQVIVRGLRAITDFEYELQLSQTNRVIAPDIDTIFLTTNLKYSYLSSSIVKEIARYQGDIRAFLHPEIAQKVAAKIMSANEMKPLCSAEEHDKIIR
ncbi:MAG: pantetheine-phosphate adenylyltransferase [Lachnospiraceae bacterium]